MAAENMGYQFGGEEADMKEELRGSDGDGDGDGDLRGQSQESGQGPAPGQPGHPSFRRQRASRACETCHARKVRCDAASLGVPCTNCVAFSIECKIPTPKRKRAQTKTKDSDSDRSEPKRRQSPLPTNHSAGALGLENPPYVRPNIVDPLAPQQVSTPGSEADAQQQNAAGQNFMKPKFARAPIKEAGRVAFLGESSNLSLLVQDRFGTTDVVHYPLPENARGSRAGMDDLDATEIDILHQRGAFLLPPRPLCDELVESFFKWVAPVVPVINRCRFMRRYRDAKNPPSLLLLQAILLAGSRVCTNPQLLDAKGSTQPASMTFYKRTKALYDANYEDDRVTIVQALVLMGWYWEGPEDVTKNVYYWSRVATVVAQGSGMHRSVEGSQLSKADKRLWKRIWWTLFTRDRSVAVALGRPVSINVDDADVEMVSEDDFIEDEDGHPSIYPVDNLHVQFFLQYVKLCEIMGLVLSQQYSVASKSRRTNAIDLTHSDMALADWMQNCPQEVHWEKDRHHFWSALLHSNYYTTLCLLHRAHMPPAVPLKNAPNGYGEEANYPSKNIAFQASFMITSIIDTLNQNDQIRYCPAFIVYSLFSALIMHVHQMRSSVPSVVSATHERIGICMGALKEVSKVWLVAKMVQTLFESILGNKLLEDKMQKAAGKRHHRAKPPGPPGGGREAPTKRKFDDMELGFANGPPAQQVSYERSRPQTPALTPSRDLGQNNNAGNMPAPSHPSASPHLRQQQNDAFLGNGTSRGNTRPTSPFNPSLSVPHSPPDFFLVTRDSPSISQDLLDNFQPNQLFPESAHNLALGQVSPPQPQAPIDPQLAAQSMASLSQSSAGPQGTPIPPGMTPQQAQRPMAPPNNNAQINGMHGVSGPQMQNMPNIGQAWPQSYDSVDMPLGSPDDTWSNSSKSQAVPTTLNVEDWFQFFGINGDLSSVGGERGV